MKHFKTLIAAFFIFISSFQIGYAKECIFCKIVQGKEKAHIVWESATHIAFLDIFPNTKGATLVISKKHLDSYFANLPPEELSKLMTAAQDVSKLLDTKLKADRTGLIFLGLTVPHIHAKLYPIHDPGNEKYVISTQRGKRAPDKELAELARFLREGQTPIK
ncbi:MAG: HIT family protein [Proteobacteria bacterium]|nr:HIT family protein [Pseudomonadota bacterium]